MMLHISQTHNIPRERIAMLVERQKQLGGHLVVYQRMWSLVFISSTQNRMEHILPSRSRFLSGLKHSVFTLIFGFWSMAGLFSVPFVLILNSRGGIDITERLSNRPADEWHQTLAAPGQSEKDVRIAQWIYVGMMGCLAVLVYILASR